MGACRGLNLLLGMSQAPALGGPVAWLAAVSLAVFVAGVTWISRSETESGQTAGIVAGLAVEGLGIVGLLTAALQPRAFPSPRTDAPIGGLEGLPVLLLVALAVSLATARAIREPIPARVQKAVKTGVLALVWLDVGLVLSVRGATAALPVALLWLPAFLLGRWLYSTRPGPVRAGSDRCTPGCSALAPRVPPRPLALFHLMSPFAPRRRLS
jgi:4-hydroxybenzoate polyprenyltransferase